MDLFDYQPNRLSVPLAEKMRPRTLEEFYGQKHLLGEGKPLRELIERDHLLSMILQGPPSTGKTSLAYLIRDRTQADFIQLNGVSLTTSELRETMERAKENRRLYRRKTILFIDEIHALKSNVQMTLLPVVEDGTIILIGATTESVMHDLIPPLVSRCRVFQLKPLSKEEMKEILLKAIADDERGLGELGVTITEEALHYLIDIVDGDIRSALNTLEMAAYSVKEGKKITLDTVKAALAVRITKTSTTDFYDLISAFIKSVRAGATDGALYWLARLLYIDTDPLYIARRLVISAAEDIGMANPHALQMAVAAKQAVEFIGMPEARIPLAEATIFLCESPKSNSAYKAIGHALEWVKENPSQPVPDHLKNSTGLYVNPIDHPGTKLTYLPTAMEGVTFYRPQNSGIEERIYAKYKRENRR
ncbi:replication-associated recombination protein A [Thermicanus aegyptius]|uniref:replication-associated recombination protein A n=1 Tax=Thermicanus aegyptius TaxID=94009 RepID=UPI00048FB28A|nr:replication-associated recombination protein A [Thermicanus aegyptius]